MMDQPGDKSEHNDIRGLRSFLTLGYSELNLLAFNECFETGSGNSAEMCEHIRAVFLLDETKTFAFVEPLDFSSLRHDELT
jgi:hypothetical protein